MSVGNDPVAIGKKDIPRFFPFSVRSWERMDATQSIPAGYRVQGRKLWRMADLRLWAQLGFPDRAAFEQAKADLMK